MNDMSPLPVLADLRARMTFIDAPKTGSRITDDRAGRSSNRTVGFVAKMQQTMEFHFLSVNIRASSPLLDYAQYPAHDFPSQGGAHAAQETLIGSISLMIGSFLCQGGRLS
jgi:hypothetical protein